jgi:hypothetical protein
MMKNSIYFLLRSCVLAAVATAFAANATQTVQPVKDAAGTAFGGSGTAWTGTAGLGTTVTIVGRYTTDAASGNESGLGLKVKYDESKFTGVTVTALSTKCMIAPPQVQSAGAASQAVLGWIDTAVRNPVGGVGWPYLADPATAAGPPATSPCLNPNTPANDTTATAAGAVNLFQFQGTLAPSVGVGGTAVVSIVSDGNYSYAGAAPGMANQTVTITAVAAPTCSLDVDGNGSVTAFRDGILIVRYLLGLTSTALVSGLSPAPDPTVVSNNINNILSSIDVNGNLPTAGTTAFVDGILLIRMMLGLNGTALTSGISLTAANSTRTTPAALVNYVNSTCSTTFTP